MRSINWGGTSSRPPDGAPGTLITIEVLGVLKAMARAEWKRLLQHLSGEPSGWTKAEKSKTIAAIRAALKSQ